MGVVSAPGSEGVGVGMSGKERGGTVANMHVHGCRLCRTFRFVHLPRQGSIQEECAAIECCLQPRQEVQALMEQTLVHTTEGGAEVVCGGEGGTLSWGGGGGAP